MFKKLTILACISTILIGSFFSSQASDVYEVTLTEKGGNILVYNTEDEYKNNTPRYTFWLGNITELYFLCWFKSESEKLKEVIVLLRDTFANPLVSRIDHVLYGVNLELLIENFYKGSGSPTVDENELMKKSRAEYERITGEPLDIKKVKAYAKEQANTSDEAEFELKEALI